METESWVFKLLFFCMDLLVGAATWANVSDIRLSDEKRLTLELLRRYSKIGRSGRPVTDSSKPVTVYMGFGLKQMDLDEKNKVLTLSMWTRYKWEDQYLKWSEPQYGNLMSIRLASTDIWIPDIQLHNTADVQPPMRDSLLVVTSRGDVYWMPHTIYRSSCSIDVTNFPFDIQKCHLKFGSWTHNIDELNLTMLFPGGLDTEVYNGEKQSTWALIKWESNRMDDDGYVALYFRLHLRRRMVFSAYILTLPCVFLSTLTLVVFWLPPDRPDRTALAMSLFASFMVLLLILVEAAPPTASSVPLLGFMAPVVGIYYCFNMVIIMCSIILSSFVVNLSRGGSSGNRVPKWLSVLAFEILGKAFCIKKPLIIKRYSPVYKENRTVNGNSPEELPLNDYVNSNINLDHQENIINENRSRMNANTLKPLLEGIQKSIQEATRGLTKIDHRINSKLTYEREILSSRKEWKTVALCMDRLFFSIYLCLNVISLAVFFPRTV